MFTGIRSNFSVRFQQLSLGYHFTPGLGWDGHAISQSGQPGEKCHRLVFGGARSPEHPRAGSFFKNIAPLKPFRPGFLGIFKLWPGRFRAFYRLADTALDDCKDKASLSIGIAEGALT